MYYNILIRIQIITCSAPWLVARDGGSAVPQLELDITDTENIASGEILEWGSAPALARTSPGFTWHKASDLELGLGWRVQPQDLHPALDWLMPARRLLSLQSPTGIVIAARDVVQCWDSHAFKHCCNMEVAGSLEYAECCCWVVHTGFIFICAYCDGEVWQSVRAAIGAILSLFSLVQSIVSYTKKTSDNVSTMLTKLRQTINEIHKNYLLFLINILLFHQNITIQCTKILTTRSKWQVI